MAFEGGSTEALINTTVQNLLQTSEEVLERILVGMGDERDPEFEKVVYPILSDIIFTFSLQQKTPITTLVLFISSLISRHKKLIPDEDVQRVTAYLMAIFEISISEDINEEQLTSLFVLLKAITLNPNFNKEIETALPQEEYIKLLNEIFMLGCMRIFSANNIKTLSEIEAITVESGFMAILRFLELYSEIMSGEHSYDVSNIDLESLQEAIVSNLPKLSVESFELARMEAIKEFAKLFAFFISRAKLDRNQKKLLIDKVNGLFKQYFDLLIENGFSDEEIKYRIKSVMDNYGKRNGLIYSRPVVVQPQKENEVKQAAETVERSSVPDNHFIMFKGAPFEIDQESISMMFKGELDPKRHDIKKILKRVKRLMETKLLVDFSWNGFNSAYKLVKGVYSSGGLIRDPVALNEQKGYKGYLLYPLVDNLSIRIEFDFDNQLVAFSLVDFKLEL